jgi:ElaB/YqjD/DUF883 family membrane-anchored ribosome-binding protein
VNEMLTAPTPDVQSPKEKLVRDLRNVIDDTEELLRLTAEQVGERVVEVRKRAQGSLVQARAQLARVQAEAVARGGQAKAEVDQYVHAHPWKAIGVVGLAGLIIGTLISRR